jgi:hypothetical protein
MIIAPPVPIQTESSNKTSVGYSVIQRIAVPGHTTLISAFNRPKLLSIISFQIHATATIGMIDGM